MRSSRRRCRCRTASSRRSPASARPRPPSPTSWPCADAPAFPHARGARMGGDSIAFLRPTLRLKRRCRRPAQHRPGESSGQLQPAAENRGQRLHEAVQQAGRLVVRHRDRLPPRLPDGRARHRPSDRGVPAASRLDELLQRWVEALGRVGPGVGSATEVDVAPHTAVNDRVQAARVLRVFAWVNPLYLDTSVMVVSELV